MSRLQTVCIGGNDKDDRSVNDKSLGQLGSYHVIQTSKRPRHHLPDLISQSAPSLHARCFLLHTFPSCYVNLQGNPTLSISHLPSSHHLCFPLYSACQVFTMPAGNFKKAPLQLQRKETLRRAPRKHRPSQSLQLPKSSLRHIDCIQSMLCRLPI